MSDWNSLGRYAIVLINIVLDDVNWSIMTSPTPTPLPVLKPATSKRRNRRKRASARKQKYITAEPQPEPRKPVTPPPRIPEPAAEKRYISLMETADPSGDASGKPRELNSPGETQPSPEPSPPPSPEPAKKPQKKVHIHFIRQKKEKLYMIRDTNYSEVNQIILASPIQYEADGVPDKNPHYAVMASLEGETLPPALMEDTHEFYDTIHSMCKGATYSVVSARQCYNYKEEPRIRHCDNGCCGKDYAEYCCDITLQVVGSVVGGLIVLVIIAILAYYCYAKKTKWRRSGAGGGGILSRFGLRRNVSHVRPGPDVHSQPRRVPLPQPGHMSHAHIGTGYTQQMPGQYPDQNNLHRPVQPALAPTAPMPPPYTIEPPPYAPVKGPSSQAPPSYSDVVYNTGQGYKYGDYNGVMPPPSN